MMIMTILVSEMIIPWWWFWQFSMKSHMSHGKLYWKKTMDKFRCSFLVNDILCTMYDTPNYGTFRFVFCIYAHSCIWIHPVFLPSSPTVLWKAWAWYPPSIWDHATAFSHHIPYTIYHTKSHRSSPFIQSPTHTLLASWSSQPMNTSLLIEQVFSFHPHFFLICIWCCLIFLNSSLRPCFS